MKLTSFFLLATLAYGQEIKPDTVIGSVAGKPLTLAEAQKLIVGIKPEGNQVLEKDPEALLSNIVFFRHLAELGHKEGLHERSPLKEQLELQRIEVMARAYVNEKVNLSNPKPDEVELHYADNKAKYEQVKVRVIYVSFTSDGAPQAPTAKKPLKEPEAKAKIEGLAQKVKAGADFGKLSRENSDDEDLAKKDGDYGTFKPTDTLPAEVKAVIFVLKTGEVSAPVKLPNGFYLFKAEAKSAIPFGELRERLYEELKRERFNKWFQTEQQKFKVKLDKPEALRPSAPPPKPAQ